MSQVMFKFLEEPDRFAADVPDDTDTQAEAYAVVGSSSGVRSVQYAVAALYNLTLTRVGDLSGPAGGIQPVEMETTDAPRFPVVTWTLPSGVVWVAVDSHDEAAELAADLVVSEGSDGLPSVQVSFPLTGGDLKDPVQREFYGFPLGGDEFAGLRFIRTGPFGSDSTTSAGGVFTASVATSLGVSVECSGDPANASRIQDVANSVAASLVSSRQAMASGSAG
jgi:hypothetical protein